MVKVFIGLVIFSMFEINVIGTAAQGRLVYSMSRDNMLPFSRFFRRVNPRTQTPIIALVTFGIVNIVVMYYGYLQTNAFSTLVGSSAIIPYIIYFLITIAYAMKRRVMERIPGAFSLGRFAPVVIGGVLVWTTAVICSLSLPGEFHNSDKVILGAAVLAFLWYVLALRRRLRSGDAGVRPIEEMVSDS
jgi:amino acid transporter